MLKATCDLCSQSKIKCNGAAPCGRCCRRRTKCTYQTAQRRGRRNHMHALKATTQDATVGVYTRRVVRITLSLFKYHRAPSPQGEQDWFTAQLNHILRHLADGNAVWRHLLMRFFLRHGIRFDSCVPTAAPVAWVNLPKLSAPSLPQHKLPYLGTILMGETKVHCSSEVTRWFGFHKDGSNFPFPNPAKAAGLPFGADLLCQISEDDSAVLQFVRDATPRPIAVRTARNSTLQCYFTCQVRRDWTSFDWFLAEDQRVDNLALKLPDLELGPWDNERQDASFQRLLEWAAPA